jgi:uncharacterized protein (DUF1501 family)
MHDLFNQAALSRREVLRLGGLCGLSLSTADLLRHRAQAATVGGTFGRAKQVIMLYLHGGHPQQETFDPKPDGPSAVRGELGAIATSQPGVHFSEVLPQTARLADRLAIVRSMSHDNPNHVQASLLANTGHKHPPNSSRGDFPPSDSDFPPFGAVLDAIRPVTGSLPTWVRIGPLMRRSNGTVLHGQLPGFLGGKHTSFVVDQSLTAQDVRIDALSHSDSLSSIRLTARRNLREQFNAHQQIAVESVETQNLDVFYQRAFDLLAGERAARAFNLASEPARVRERYGPTEFGQRCLLARRLAEAGVPMINVSYCHTPSGSWDTHGKNFTSMRNSLGPTFDAAFSALIEDLEQRGMSDETLVIATAEFGRTPTINGNAGRDHWPWVYSVALAGAGIAAGTVYGASDNSAAYPTANPHDPRDLAATIYHLLGVPPDTVLHDAIGRPHPLVVGKPVAGVLA